MSEVLERASEAARRLYADIERARREGERLLEHLEERNLVVRVKLGGSARAVGIDGSLATVLATPVAHVFIARAVAVTVEGGVLADYWDAVYEPTGVREQAQVRATLRMLELELRALADALRTGLPVVIDGPIVDPPYTPSDPEAAELAGSLHSRRATILRRLRGVPVIGYVKSEAPRGGPVLAGVRVNAVTAATVLAAAADDGEAACLGPLPLNPLPVAYAGLNLAAGYVYLPWWDLARRIEVAGADFAAACRLIASLTPAGLEHPAPVALAHRLSGIPAHVARAVRQLVASQVATLHPLRRV